MSTVIGYAQQWRGPQGEITHTFDTTKEDAEGRVNVDHWRKVGNVFPVRNAIADGKYDPSQGVYDEASHDAAVAYWSALTYESNCGDHSKEVHAQIDRMLIAVERLVTAYVQRENSNGN